VQRHGDHFAHDTSDVDWLRSVSRNNWVVLTHDQRIRYKVNERMAVMQNGIAMFVLVGSVPYSELARSFVALLPRVEAFLRKYDPPFIARVYQPSPSDLARNSKALGRVEPWLLS